MCECDLIVTESLRILISGGRKIKLFIDPGRSQLVLVENRDP